MRLRLRLRPLLARRPALGLAAATALVGAGARATEPGRDAGPGPGATRADASRDLVRPERVYPFGERPRADGPVQASVADEELARWNVGGRSDPAYPSNRPGFHAAPRIMVDVAMRAGVLPVRSSKKGVLSETAVLAQARNRGYWPFRLCFEAGLHGDPKLRGKTRVRVVVAPNGHVRSTRPVSTDLADPETARCLAARAGQLKFAPPPERRLDATIDVELSPGDAPLPELRLGGFAPAPAAAPLDARALEAMLGGAISPAESCFSAARQADPRLWGRILFRVDVDRHGNVTVREHESRFPDPQVVRCISTAVQALPLASIAAGPTSFTWGLRLGWPPSFPSSNQAENTPAAPAPHSPVADSPAPRVRVAR